MITQFSDGQVIELAAASGVPAVTIQLKRPEDFRRHSCSWCSLRGKEDYERDADVLAIVLHHILPSATHRLFVARMLKEVAEAVGGAWAPLWVHKLVARPEESEELAAAPVPEATP